MRPTPLNVISQKLGMKSPSQALIHGIAIDSRTVKLGDLFFALPGKKTDGHHFIKQAKEQGAAAAIVSYDFDSSHIIDFPLIKVPDVTRALQDIARQMVRERQPQIIAITGSFGKTSTKDFLTAFLKKQYRVHSSPLSYNSQLTLPLTILMADGDEEILVLEMGMSEPGQIEKLLGIAPPDLAILTAVGLQHAARFSNGLEGIGNEKSSIFTHPKTRLGILNRDSPYFEAALQKGICQKKSYSIIDPHADYFAEITTRGVRVHVKGETACEIDYRLPSRGFYRNLLAAVAAARSFDVAWSSICQAAKTDLNLPPMRFQKIQKSGALFINDAYNANPESTCMSLQSLPKPWLQGRRIAVLSEMDDLGDYSFEGHKTVAETALSSVDILLCLGSLCQTMETIWNQKNRPVVLFHNKDKLIDALKKTVRPGDVVLLKGARSHALEEILDHF